MNETQSEHAQDDTEGNGQEVEDQNADLRRRDALICAVLLGLLGFIFVESLNLTFNAAAAKQSLLVTPGIFPLLLTAALLVMVLALLIVSLREGRFSGYFSRAAILRGLLKPETLNKLTQVALLCIYVFVLVGRVHFGVATGLYLFASMATSQTMKLWRCALVGAGVAAAVYAVFGVVMKIPLP